MDSKTYWRNREEEALKKYQKSEAEYDKEIEQIYKDMLDGVQTQINSFYGKYAKAEGISIAEAKKRVRKLDIEEYERKAARYVRDAALDRKANGGKTNKKGYYFSPKAEEEMRLYNATMKITRLEMLKANIGLELIKGHDELDKFMGDILKGRTEEELKRQAGILGKTIRNNAQLAHTIPNASFHNATFSDRIWQYQDLMREDLGKILSRALIQGKNPRAVAKDLQKYWYGNDPRTGGGAVYCMERLMRTEMARVQTEAQKQSFIKNGFTEYEFIANADCCGICKALDGKHFKVSKMMPGENAAPIHPHCRCSVAAYEDSDDYEAWLDYLDKGGTTAEWNRQKAKHTAASEKEKQYGVKYGSAAMKVDRAYINSKEYKKKFDKLTDNPTTNEAIYEVAKETLKHRDGTAYEDMYLLGVDGNVLSSVTNSSVERGVTYTDEFKKALEKSIKDSTPTIAIHNHPEGTPPSADDFRKAFENKYSLGVIIGHNGQVYIYGNNSVELTSQIAEEISNDIAFFYRNGYDIDNASKMVYNGYGLNYTIVEGVD